MIDLTPLDVRNKRGDFKKGMRGYDPQEVDVFLELVAERLEVLVRENIKLRDRTQTLQEQVEAQSGREQAVQDALVTAQELRKDIREQSQREADHVIREAESEARRVIAEAEAEVRKRLRGVERQMDHARSSLQELERRRTRFLQEFRGLLQRELDVVEVEEGRTPLEDRTIDLDLGAPRSPAREADTGVWGGSDDDGLPDGEASPEGTPPSDAGSTDGGSGGEDGTDDGVVAAPGSSTTEAGGSSHGGTAAAGVAAASSTASARRGETDAPDDAPQAAVEAPSGAGSGGGASTAEPSGAHPGPDDGPSVSEPVVQEREAALDADVGELVDRGNAGSGSRPSAPPPEVGDAPSSLELELMAGAAGSDGAEAAAPSTFPDVPDLETVLAEAGIDEVKPPESEEISPPPVDSATEDRLALFDEDDDDEANR